MGVVTETWGVSWKRARIGGVVRGNRKAGGGVVNGERGAWSRPVGVSVAARAGFRSLPAAAPCPACLPVGGSSTGGGRVRTYAGAGPALWWRGHSGSAVGGGFSEW